MGSQKTWKNKCDRLYSQIIRSKGHCEFCGAKPPNVQLQTSHIFSRRYSWTRTDLQNAVAACASCHLKWHHEPTEQGPKAIAIIGEDEYDRIRERRLRREKFDWESEHQRLSEIWKEIQENPDHT